MTKRLILLRHAKAAEAGSDFDRPLTGNGVTAAATAGRWLAEHHHIPDHVVVSPARRAVQTWASAAAELNASPAPVTDDRIYANTVEDLLEVLGQAPASAETVVLVGHNPSIAELAAALDDGTGDAQSRREVSKKYPPGAIAVLSVAGDWASVGPGGATLLSFTTPGSG